MPSFADVASQLGLPGRAARLNRSEAHSLGDACLLIGRPAFLNRDTTYCSIEKVPIVPHGPPLVSMGGRIDD
jgi:hypothetical protein